MYGLIAWLSAPPLTASAGPGLAPRVTGAATIPAASANAAAVSLHAQRVLRMPTIVAPHRAGIGSAQMIVSILVRRLRDGKTYDDFREAWLPEKGFGWPTRVVTGQRMDDPREIVTIGFSDITPEQGEALLAQVGLEDSGAPRSEAAGHQDEEHLGEVAEEQLARRDRISEVIEPEMTRTFYVQLAEDDLT